MNYEKTILALQEKVLELQERVIKLEGDVAALKNGTALTVEPFEQDGFSPEIKYTDEPGSINTRDTTKYKLDGILYGKGRLVLAVVRKYVEQHPGITAEKLMSVFDKSLQGSLGVIRSLEDTKRSNANYKLRFFAANEELIHTASDVCVVCSQWGIFNINHFVTRAKQLGIDVTISESGTTFLPYDSSESLDIDSVNLNSKNVEVTPDRPCPIDTRRRPQESFQDFVKRTLEYMFNNSLLQPKELELLQTKEYSKRTLGLEFALLEENSLKIRDAQDHPRYWTGHKLGGRYYVCSQWWKQKMDMYEPLFESWIKRICYQAT